MPGWDDFKTFFVWEWRALWCDKTRLLSPILFGLSSSLILNFSLAGVGREFLCEVFVAKLFLPLLLVGLLILMESFSAEDEDAFLTHWRASSINPLSWFGVRWTVILGSHLLLFTPIIVFSFMADGEDLFLVAGGLWQGFQRIVLYFGLLMVFLLVGLSSLGLLVSALVFKTSQRGVLLPLLYFPLATPFLLAGGEALAVLLRESQNSTTLLSPFTPEIWSWLSLLMGGACLFFVLGILFFRDIFELNS